MFGNLDRQLALAGRFTSGLFTGGLARALGSRLADPRIGILGLRFLLSLGLHLRPGGVLDQIGVAIELGMEDCILRGITGVKVLHEGREVPVRRVVRGHEVLLDKLRAESQLPDHVSDVEADLAVFHVHLEFAERHAVVGPGDELGHGEALLFITDEEGKIGADLEILSLVGDPCGEAEAGVLSAHAEGHLMVIRIGRVLELLGIQVVQNSLEWGVVI